jgi:large subunit ribosomal protein L35
MRPRSKKPPGRACRGGLYAVWAQVWPKHNNKRLSRAREKGSKMPKMKTKSAAKKRFKITGTGKVLSAAAGKRHGMIKRSNKFIRNARGTMVLFKADGEKVVKNFLPNGGGI